MKYKITNPNCITPSINNQLIDPIIFNEKQTEFEIKERETEIDHLINWIAKSESESDKYLMKEDLKYLISLPNKYILSSTQTNDYITEKDGQNILKDIYNLNKKILCKK